MKDFIEAASLIELWEMVILNIDTKRVHERHEIQFFNNRSLFHSFLGFHDLANITFQQ